ncbi:hypothetical protein F66182_1315 [Fusarium sp. NRRL 66182]|nr:hypothetical protein F66182_1315 [Fusarium sp. NRRL 66182]
MASPPSALHWHTGAHFAYKPTRPGPQDDEWPLISVVVPVFNESEFIHNSIQSILLSNYPKHKLELIIINDGSTDDTWEHVNQAVRALPSSGISCRLLQHSSNLGKRKAIQSGFAAALGSIIISLDSDSVLESGSLRNIVSPLMRDPAIGAVAGHLSVLNVASSNGFSIKHLLPRLLDIIYEHIGNIPRSALSAEGFVTILPGAFSAFRTNAVRDHIDTLCTSTFLGSPLKHGEDMELAYLILNDGWKTIYQSNAVVHTMAPETLQKAFLMFSRWERTMYTFLCMGYPALTAREALKLWLSFRPRRPQHLLYDLDKEKQEDEFTIPRARVGSIYPFLNVTCIWLKGPLMILITFTLTRNFILYPSLALWTLLEISILTIWRSLLFISDAARDEQTSDFSDLGRLQVFHKRGRLLWRLLSDGRLNGAGDLQCIGSLGRPRPASLSKLDSILQRYNWCCVLSKKSSNIARIRYTKTTSFQPVLAVKTPMDRTTWLDGLRGIAAAIVTADHYFLGSVVNGGFMTAGFRSYWAEPPEANRMLIQQPPIRVIFSVEAMVPLFFVISGYAISVNLLQLRDTSRSEFLQRLSSTVTRRVLRIYLPVFCIASISQLIFFFDLYQWDFGDLVWGRRPWTAPWSHVTFVFRYMLDNMNIVSFQTHVGLNTQLWTMAFEFRDSYIIYLAVLGLASWQPSLRRLALGALIAYWFYLGVWDVYAFLAGLYLAEMHVISSPGSVSPEAILPHLSWLPSRPKSSTINLTIVPTYLSFILGVWLVCINGHGSLPPGYQFLALIEPSPWESDWDTISQCWRTTGSILVVYAISKSIHLQHLLNSALIQFLGKISFSLYLVHQSIYHLFQRPVRDCLWYIATWKPFPGTQEAINHTALFAFSWLGGFVLLSALNLYVAHLYTKFVDERCVEFAKKFDRWITHVR